MVEKTFDRFPDHSMMSLTAEKVRYDLAESVGPDLKLSDVYSSTEIAELACLSLEYRTATGSNELRSIIAKQHNVQTDEVITTVGGMQAIFLCGAVLCNKTDHVLVQQPSFPLTQSALAFNDAELEFLPCRFSDGYQLDIDYLASRLKPQTSLVCLASPQNPSGVAIAHNNIVQILDAMRRYSPNAFLLMDETYRQASYGHDELSDSLASLDERVISCASLSKCHGTPGLRIGWAITLHEQLRKQLINGKFQTIICCSGLDEAVALRVLERSETLFAQRRTHLQKGLDTVPSEKLEQFHRELQQHSVRVAPGTWFGDEPEVFRLGFGLLPIPELAQGLEAISHVLEKLR